MARSDLPPSSPYPEDSSSYQLPSDVLNTSLQRTNFEEINFEQGMSERNEEFFEDIDAQERRYKIPPIGTLYTQPTLPDGFMVRNELMGRQRLGRALRSQPEDFIPIELDPVDEGNKRIGGFLLGALGYTGITDIPEARQPKGSDPTFSPVVRPRNLTLAEIRQENEALSLRTFRMNSGELGRTLADMRRDPDTADLIGAFENRAQDFAERTTRPGQRHRDLTPTIAAVMSEPEVRKRAQGALRATVVEGSDNLKQEAKENGEIVTDVAILGGGVHGAIIAAEILATDPSKRVVIVDNHSQLGGQFNGYGTRPVFKINSRDRAQDLDELGLPGRLGNLNSFGDRAPVQLGDITCEAYADNLGLGNAAEWNGFLSACAMVDTEAMRIKGAFDPYSPYVRLQTADTITGDELQIASRYLIVAGGIGERTKQAGVLSAVDFLSRFGDANNKFPLDEFKDKRIALIGGGDNARVCAMMLAGLGPKEAYGYSKIQFGTPDGIVWIGTDFGTRQEFCDNNRSAYTQLKSFITDDILPRTNQFKPVKSRVSNVLVLPNGKKRVSLESPETGRVFNPFDGAVYDVVIDCRPLVDTTSETLFGQDMADLPTVDSVINLGAGRQTIPASIARRYGRKVFAGGAGAELPLTPFERNTYNGLIVENTKSIWAQKPRAQQLGNLVGQGIINEADRASRRFS
jgi:hypothetical protein